MSMLREVVQHFFLISNRTYRFDYVILFFSKHEAYDFFCFIFSAVMTLSV